MTTVNKIKKNTLSADPQTSTIRNSSFETLRIIAMLFIVLSHACVHSNFNVSNQPLSFNRVFLQWGTLGNLGVDIFVIISGYFLCNKELSTKSVSRLLSQVWFYSVSLFFVCSLGFNYHYGIRQLIQVFLPTIFEEYWFFTAYIVLLLLSPFLNILIKASSRRQLMTLLITMLMLWVVIRTFTSKNMYGTEIPQLTMFYTIGAYLRNYPDNWLQKKLHRTLITTVSFLLLFMSTVILGILESKIPALVGKSAFFYHTSSVIIVGCAVGLISIFQNIKPFYNKTINAISGCTFGVYLIHDNPVVRSILWTELLDNTPYFNSNTLIPRVLLSVLAVFLVCTFIEFIRKKTIERTLTNIVDSIINTLIKQIKAFEQIL